MRGFSVDNLVGSLDPVLSIPLLAGTGFQLETEGGPVFIPIPAPCQQRAGLERSRVPHVLYMAATNIQFH